MNTPVREGETIEGSRTMRNRPYPVLKCSSGNVRVLEVKLFYFLVGGRAGRCRLAFDEIHV